MNTNNLHFRDSNFPFTSTCTYSRPSNLFELAWNRYIYSLPRAVQKTVWGLPDKENLLEELLRLDQMKRDVYWAAKRLQINGRTQTAGDRSTFLVGISKTTRRQGRSKEVCLRLEVNDMCNLPFWLNMEIPFSEIVDKLGMRKEVDNGRVMYYFP